VPHDKNGQLVQEGDRVNVPCIVDSVQPGTDYCNVTLHTVEPMPPYTGPNTITLNTRQIEKLANGE
jgi:hypothetical protein